jgi:hypothetical protein
VLSATLTVACSKQPAQPPEDLSSNTNRLSQELLSQLAAHEAQERLLNETVWATEILAQHHGLVLDSLWDSVNAATNKFAVLAAFPVGHIVLGNWTATSRLPHDIELRASESPGRILSQADWQQWLLRHETDGWQLSEMELRHNRFDTDDANQPRESLFYFAAHLTHREREHRAIIEGDLIVHWTPRPEAEVAAIRQIDASRLVIKSRLGKPPFPELLQDHLSPTAHSQSVDPVIVYDLDNDGLSEIILAARNLVYLRPSNSLHYLPQPLCSDPATAILSAVMGDFDGDGNPDFLCATLEGLKLFPGSGKAAFEQASRLALPAPPGWRYPMALTAGDIDNDGDLDLFVGQYRVPYEHGSLPTPYYDANDGNPAFLLLNNGDAVFTDATQSAGLENKRWRRTYSASLADLNQDGHLDLVVVSDFAGVDLYLNNGKGHFTDVTEAWVPDPRAFGMAHALTDFNADGLLDLLVIGMTSPTVDRLNHLELWRPDILEDRAMPGRMMYGNRLLLARPTGGFEQTPLSDDVARSGWSWGCAASDFDNDGFVDVYVANGLESRDSVRDYESEYWLHDRFIGKSEPDPSVYLYFQSKFGRTRGRGQSYGGYERNRFYLNDRATAFRDVAHLMGLGLQEDARHAIADDLDGDGHVDLVTTGFEPWPASRQILRVYRNTLARSANWIGFRFREEPGCRSPLGASVLVRYGGHSTIRQIVTGDSHRSQHPLALHFGLGNNTGIEWAEIRWPGGLAVTMPNPALNQYHDVSFRRP